MRRVIERLERNFRNDSQAEVQRYQEHLDAETVAFIVKIAKQRATVFTSDVLGAIEIDMRARVLSSLKRLIRDGHITVQGQSFSIHNACLTVPPVH